MYEGLVEVLHLSNYLLLLPNAVSHLDKLSLAILFSALAWCCKGPNVLPRLARLMFGSLRLPEAAAERKAAAKRRALLGPEGEDEPEGGSNLLDADHDEDLSF